MFSNKTYDVLNQIARIVLPAVIALWLTVGSIWGFPYIEAVGGTLAALNVFLGALLKVSTSRYNKTE